MTILEKAGSGSVEPEDFNRVVDELNDAGPAGSVTAADVDSQSAQDGDVLTADGAGGASWEASGGGSAVDVGQITGSYQVCAGYRGVYANKGASLSNTDSTEMGADTDQDCFMPWFLPAAVSVTQFAWKVVGGSGVVGLYRMGLYQASSAWQPADLLWDSGEQDTSDETMKTAAVALDLDAGQYLAAFCADGDAIANGYSFEAFDWLGAVDIGLITTDLETVVGAGPLIRARSFGAFPDPGGAVASSGSSFDDLGSVGWPLFCKVG